MTTVTIEKLIFGGQGLGRVNNKIAFVWGALPGETVECRIIKSKKNYFEAIATNIITPSPDRQPPTEKHYLACSPWSVMSYAKENEWKQKIALETYRKVGNLSVPEDIELVFDTVERGYRNKIEYSFVDSTDGLSFSFHERGNYHPLKIDHCTLATEAINKTADIILQLLQKQKITARELKSLIIRSNLAGETVAALFIKNENNLLLPKLSGGFKGIQVYYSNPLSPASNPDKLLQSNGDNFLVETIFGRKLKYGALSFFQVNVPIFEQALKDMEPYVTKDKKILDYYSGVGAISLSLLGEKQECTLVENNMEAVGYAKENIIQNKFKNAIAHLIGAESGTEHIAEDSVVILDPPRAGLDKKVVQSLLEKKPHRIVYLSCDLATHARDISLLSEAYKPVFWRLYNFFPRTPHIEGLCVLEKNI